MAHLSPSTIFSPSVARQQLATSKDWNHIDAWLSRQYAPKAPPPIERTPETLKALLTLSSLNESADEARDLHHLSTLHALKLLKSHEKEEEETTPESETLLLESLTENQLSREGETALEALTTLSLLLNVQDGSTEHIARKILELQVQDFDITQALSRIEVMHQHLSSESKNLDATISSLESNTSLQPDADLSKQVIEWNRKSKALAAKLPEMRERVTSLENASGSGKSGTYPTIQEVVEEEKRFKELEREVRDLETQVRGFHGLPQDTDLARLEVEGLRVELKELGRQRDALFEGLVERETPRRKR